MVALIFVYGNLMQPETQKHTDAHTRRIRGEKRGKKVVIKIGPPVSLWPACFFVFSLKGFFSYFCWLKNIGGKLTCWTPYWWCATGPIHDIARTRIPVSCNMPHQSPNNSNKSAKIMKFLFNQPFPLFDTSWPKVTQLKQSKSNKIQKCWLNHIIGQY